MLKALTAILLAITLSLPCIAQNLVTNGDFALDGSGWYRSHDSPWAAIQFEDREDHGKCARFSSADGTWVDLEQKIDLQPGQTYVFQLDMKRTAAGPDIRAFMPIIRENKSTDWYGLGESQTTLGEWEHLARRITAPGAMASGRILLMNRLKGAEAWFDNVQVVPVLDQSPPADGYFPKLRVPKVNVTPRIDADLSDEAWKTAGHITGFAVITDGSQPKAGTEAWVCHDGDNLLIAARCQEPEMARGRFEITGHDVGGLFGDEVVEIFIDPGNDHETYYHFAISGAGGDFDASYGEGAVGGSGYESGWVAKARRGENEWTVEASIPVAALTRGTVGEIWGLNICRERHIPGSRENSAWSTTGSRFHAPARFGDIVWADRPVLPSVQAAFVRVTDLTPGPSSLVASVTNEQDAPATVTVEANLASPDGRTQRAPVTISVPPGGATETTLPFEITARGQWHAVLKCQDPVTDQTLFTSSANPFTVPDVLEARVTKPWFRGRIFSKMALENVEIEATVSLRPEQREGMRLLARVVGQDGCAVACDRPAAQLVNVLAVPCRDWLDGDHALEVSLLDKEGETVAKVADLTVQKLPPVTEEIWIDRENNLIINGKPHFPTGFYSMDWIGRMNLAAEGGYTLFHTYASQSPAQLDPETTTWDWPKWFDTGASHGMRAFSGIGALNHQVEDYQKKLAAGEAPDSERQIREFIERWKQHPGLAAWYLYDEPSLAGRTVEEIKFLYELADGIDPYHPKVVCMVYWSDNRFNQWLDVLMPDPYPIRATNSRPLRSVADAVRTARRTVGDAKPVWPVLQWYQYPGGRYPTPREMRCMAFMAVAAGGKGLTWYSFYQGYKGDSAHWPDLAAIGRELRACEDVVLAPYAIEPVQVSPADAPIEAMVKQTPGELHIVVVNAEDRDLEAVTITLPAAATSANDRLADEDIPVNGKSLTVSFAGYQPRVIDVELASQGPGK